jgi:hypothetical protein
MSRSTIASLACVIVLTAALPARALRMAPSPIPIRVATADVIVVAKVVRIEERSEKIPRFQGDKQMAEYQVAVLQITDPILNAKGITHVRVGFIPPPPAVAPRPGLPRLSSGGRSLAIRYAPGLEGCFFLKRHPFATFYHTPMYFDVITKAKNPQFSKEVAEVKKSTRLLANPMAGLKSRDANERLTVAAMLIARYRTPPPGARSLKTEPISAEESQQIMKVLAEADWAAKPTPTRFGMTPPNLFGRLGVTAKDGFQRPRDYRQYQAAAQKWVKANANTYRIQRFVVPRAEEP